MLDEKKPQTLICLPKCRINVIRLQDGGSDVMSAQTYGPCLLEQLSRVWRRVWLMTSQVDVFADPFPPRHQLTLGMMWRCRDSTTPSGVPSVSRAGFGHPRPPKTVAKVS